KEEKDVITNSVRVNIKKIEDLMDSVGELLVNYNSMEKFHENLINKKFSFNKSDKSKFFDIIAQFKRLIDMLQDNVMKFRMVPIKTLFDKLPRLIRTISKEMNKKASLSISGEYTEVDRPVIEEIREPITHIIRNSIDHGLESREERKQKGKPETGTVKIFSYQSGNNIIIEISDDGRGIDTQKIRETLRKKNLVPESKLKKLKDNQILSFIFQPGFSTSEKVTEISGRGVGMDVVKTNLEKIQGKILIKTKKDKGTSIIISIPLTVAITKALIVQSSNMYFAIPLYSIKETLRVYSDEIEEVDQYKVINLRKSLLSILRLSDMFELKDKVITGDKEDDDISTGRKKKKKNRFFVVIVNYGNRPLGLIVDKLVTEQDIVIKPLSEYVEKIYGVSGVTILGDGNVAYILDPINLIDYYLSKENKEIQIKDYA
ncbi:MAG: chemotaxis protein CheA, partial [Spirochaetes bacterium]|nr:chemotaxis protein CheA [Spirochaetota bacterium]